MDFLTRKRNIQPFNGEKYALWKFRITAVLREMNVLHILENPVPTEPTEQWTRDDSIVCGIIFEYLSDTLLNSIKDQQHGYNIITKLDSIYERKSLATQLTLRKKLLTLK